MLADSAVPVPVALAVALVIATGVVAIPPVIMDPVSGMALLTGESEFEFESESAAGAMVVVVDAGSAVAAAPGLLAMGSIATGALSIGANTVDVTGGAAAPSPAAKIVNGAPWFPESPITVYKERCHERE